MNSNPPEASGLWCHFPSMPKPCSWGTPFFACLWLIFGLAAAVVRAQPMSLAAALVCSWLGLWGRWLLALLAAVPLAAQALPDPPPARNSGPATVWESGHNMRMIEAGVDYLIEAKGQPLTPEMAGDPSHAVRWKRYEGRRINLLTQHQPVWFRFDLESRGGPPALLVSDWPLLLVVQAYQYDRISGQLIASDVRGSKDSHATGREDTAHALPLVFGDSGRTTVLLRVQSQAAMIVPLAVWGEDAYRASRHNHHLVMGVLFGVMAIMLVYNTTLLVFTRDRNYAYYAAYLLWATLYELALTGYGPLLIWGESAWLTRYGYTFFACLTFLVATLFVHNFLEIAKTGWPHQRRGTYLLVVYWIVCIITLLVYPDAVASLRITLVGGVSGLFGIYSSCTQLIRGNPSARYFTLAWLVLMVGTVAHMLALGGVVDGNWLTDYGQHVGFVVETLLLSVALADRIKRGRFAQKQALAEALALTHRVQQERDEKIKAQEEAIALQNRTHEALEVLVLDRTAALEEAKQKLQRANTELAQLSVTDALTQVHNRRYFDEVLAHEHERSMRTGAPLALLLADIDHFKTINDTCGHVAGDDCLRLVAATLRQTLGRSTDLIARYGGEEFALVLPVTGPEQAVELAERVRGAVAGIQFIHRGRLVPISISVGVVARVTQPRETVVDFIAEADAALYRAKDGGRNQVKLAA
jgi:two-component system, sensor histidine kinase LadS